MIKLGDKVWVGPATVTEDGKTSEVLAFSSVEFIPDVPNLPAIAAFLNDHPETATVIYAVTHYLSRNQIDKITAVLNGLAAAIGGAGE